MIGGDGDRGFNVKKNGRNVEVEKVSFLISMKLQNKTLCFKCYFKIYFYTICQGA